MQLKPCFEPLEPRRLLSAEPAGPAFLGTLTAANHHIRTATVTPDAPDQKWSFTLDQPLKVSFSLSGDDDVDLRLFRGKTLRGASMNAGLAEESLARTLLPGRYTLVVSSASAAAVEYKLTADTAAVASPTRVQAKPLGGTAVRVNWLDQSDNESGFAVQQWRKHKWHTVQHAPAGATAAVVHNLPVAAAMTFRVRSESIGGVGISPDAAVVQAAPVDDSGWYKITSLGGMTKSETAWSADSDTLAITPDYQDKWIYASSWEDAVYTAVEGTAGIKRTDGSIATHDFPYGGDFQLGYAGIFHDDNSAAGTTGGPDQIDGNELQNDDNLK